MVVTLAFASGGYPPADHGLLILAFALVVLVVSLVANTVQVDRRSLAFVGAIGAFALWQVASVVWAPAAAWPALDAERGLIYTAAGAALVLVVTRERVTALAAGIVAGTTFIALYALLPGLAGGGLPDTRLDAPIGYSNALGLLLAYGLLLGAGIALHRSGTVRVLAGAALVPLVVALFLTYSRGAILALLVGLLVLTLTELQVASRLPRGRLLAAAALLVVVAVALVAVAREGGARPAADRALQAFRQESLPADDQSRLVSISGNRRADYWRVAWRMVERDPLLGEGAGGFERRWTQDRRTPSNVRDAHNLYLETLAELGPLGLALLLVALAVPLSAFGRARRGALVPAATAAYAAFLVHAAVDWDWELPVLVLPALACGAILLAEARTAPPVPMTAPLRAVGVVAAVGAIAIALVAHVGNRALAGGFAALERGDTGQAEEDARRARGWMPWSHEPWQLLGEAQLASRQDAAARRSLGEALERAPEDWRLWFDLAIVSGAPRERVAITRARELNPLGDEVRDLERR
jgi:O-antigen ligase